jgi:FKBP-type peptidyl-prolyl cis-trans isomerase (trigger factor)
MITKENALLTLRPGAQWTTRGDIIEWLDSEQTQPTEEEINAEISRLQAEYDSQEYARNRQEEYPSLNDLIVALWENVVEERASSVVALEAVRQAVKTKYPK